MWNLEFRIGRESELAFSPHRLRTRGKHWPPSEEARNRAPHLRHRICNWSTRTPWRDYIRRLAGQHQKRSHQNTRIRTEEAHQKGKPESEVRQSEHRTSAHQNQKFDQKNIRFRPTRTPNFGHQKSKVRQPEIPKFGCPNFPLRPLRDSSESPNSRLGATVRGNS